MTTISAAAARSQLYPLLEKVSNDFEVVEIKSKHGTAVLVDADEYYSLSETDYLLSHPANAKRLMESVANLRAGRGVVRELVEQ